MASSELDIWQSAPLTGVGPGGMSTHFERSASGSVAAHTEMTRLLAEHGAGGVLALLVLGFILYRGWRAVGSVAEKTWLVAFAAWALVEMSHSAMRISAVGFLIGLSVLRQRPEL